MAPPAFSPAVIPLLQMNYAFLTYYKKVMTEVWSHSLAAFSRAEEGMKAVVRGGETVARIRFKYHRVSRNHYPVNKNYFPPSVTFQRYLQVRLSGSDKQLK